ncbi:zinc finger protein castor homolog 1-like isoform X2 [Ptychodera flava]|uniref:zinc finger protein castor homolog 1-like isoform X2 n=1 Tax=Ptychodera flava TaxID=63121 RepID=UPI003969FAD4
MASPEFKKRTSIRLDAICEKLKSRSEDSSPGPAAELEAILKTCRDAVSAVSGKTNQEKDLQEENNSVVTTASSPQVAMVTSEDGLDKVNSEVSEKLSESENNTSTESSECNDARSSGSDSSSVKSISSINGYHGNVAEDSQQSFAEENSEMSSQLISAEDTDQQENSLFTQDSVLDLSMSAYKSDKSDCMSPTSSASKDFINSQDNPVVYDPKMIQEYAESGVCDDDLLEETLNKSAEMTCNGSQEDSEAMMDDSADSEQAYDDDDDDDDIAIAEDLSMDRTQNQITESADLTTKENIEPGLCYDASEVRDYAADTVKEFLGLYGYESEVRDIEERLPLDKFSFTSILQLDKDLVAAGRKTLVPNSTMISIVDPSGKPVGYSKYDYYIKKLEAGESISSDILSNTGNSKYDHLMKKLEQSPASINSGAITVKELINRNLQAKKHNTENSDVGRIITAGAMKRSSRPSKYDLINIDRLKDRIKLESGKESVENGDDAAGKVVTGASQANMSSSDYIKACFSEKKASSSNSRSSNSNKADVNQILQANEMNIYTKYIAKFSASVHCGHMHCVYQYKEHYHCLDDECNYRFTRKEDVIRHYNWHKRRDNSLQHGFMRFSPADDCNVYYSGCTLNKKHTHYHCMQVGCNKVYTSTSDVITHENFHKKNAALISDGFQRFRATEDCGTLTCSFYGQKTTHFHCRRAGCDFSFKNKCDIEKHKVYHVRDDQYNSEGFKKFSKHEICKYEGCRYSKNTNHFHCIRPGCDFTFTAANQMSSHKRKHERRERLIQFEQAKKRKHNKADLLAHPVEEEMTDLIDYYHNKKSKGEPDEIDSHQNKKIKVESAELEDSQDNEVKMSESMQSTIQSSSASHDANGNEDDDHLPAAFAKINTAISTEKSDNSEGLSDSLNLPAPDEISPPVQVCTVVPTTTSSSTGKPPIILKFKTQENWQKYIKRFTANDPCESRCVMLYKDHYHCQVKDCQELFKSKDGVNKHARYHQLNDEASEYGFRYFQYGQDCHQYYQRCVNRSQQHYHCAWSVNSTDYCGHMVNTFNSHYMKIHQMKHKNSPHLTRIDEDEAKPVTLATRNVYSGSKSHSSPPARYKHGVNYGYVLYKANRCPITDCHLRNRAHFHCTKTDCHYMTTSAAKMNEHKWNENAAYDGYRQLSRKIDCKRAGCKYNMIKKHFHCIRPGCKFSFTLQSQMETHARKHLRRIYGRNFEKQPQAMASLASATQVEKIGPGDVGPDDDTPGTSMEMNGEEAMKMSVTFVTPQSQRSKQTTPTILPKPANQLSPALMNIASAVAPSNVSSTSVTAITALPLTSTPTTLHSTATSQPLPPFTIPLPPLDDDDCTPLQLTTTNTPKSLNSNTNNSNTITVVNAATGLPSTAVVNTGLPSNAIVNTGLASNAIVNSGLPSNAIVSTGLPGNQIVAAGLPSNAVVLTPATAANVNNGAGTLVYVSPVAVQSAGTAQVVLMQTPTQAVSKSPQTTPRQSKLVSPERGRSHRNRYIDEKSIQDRFMRFDRHEDCGDRSCQFSLSSTHYHCIHEKCGYKFAGRTQMYKHAQHHDRVESLVLDDFRRYKSSVHCDRESCEYAQRNTHFHCLKCTFVCTDSSKLTAHRKHHAKLETLAAAGFKHCSSSETCEVNDCKYDKKYSHLHCTHPGCTHAVVGMSQMDSHSRKHHHTP